MKIVMVMAAALALSACASATSIVTGTTRAAIAPEQVRIYTEMPAGAEIVAIVSATSRTGFTPQQSQNYAIGELKEKAARLGANGILIESAGQGSGPVVGVPVYGGGTMITGGTHPNIQDVHGKAIYVRPAS